MFVNTCTSYWNMNIVQTAPATTQYIVMINYFNMEISDISTSQCSRKYTQCSVNGHKMNFSCYNKVVHDLEHRILIFKTLAKIPEIVSM